MSKAKKDRQCNGKREKTEDIQITTQKTKLCIYFFHFRLEIYCPYFIAQYETKSRGKNG